MKIIAHRGASAERPENTLAAFARALEIGVDAIEADLLRTKDGRLVVRHDERIKQGRTWADVHDLTVEELRAIDLGGGERIPTCEALLDRFAGRIPLFLDLKAAGLARPLAELLGKRKALERMHVTSALIEELAEMANRCPTLPRSLVLHTLPPDYARRLREAGAREVSLHRSALRAATVQQLRVEGIPVRVYPVNRPEEAKRFASWEVEAVFTDNPAAMQHLRQGGPAQRGLHGSEDFG